jgi:hypothetical protein
MRTGLQVIRMTCKTVHTDGVFCKTGASTIGRGSVLQTTVGPHASGSHKRVQHRQRTPKWLSLCARSERSALANFEARAIDTADMCSYVVVRDVLPGQPLVLLANNTVLAAEHSTTMNDKSMLEMNL